MIDRVRERNSSREDITSEGDDRGGISGLQPDLAESCWCKALVYVCH